MRWFECRIEELAGQTEFLSLTIRSEPRLESAIIYESEIAIFSSDRRGTKESEGVQRLGREISLAGCGAG